MLITIPLMLLQAAAPASAAADAEALPESRRIVCRDLLGTGSRLNTQRVCLPKREWQRLHENGQEATKEIQDKAYRRPVPF